MNSIISSLKTPQAAFWARRSITLAALGLIFLGLLARGADGAAPSSLFACLLMLLLMVRLWSVSRYDVSDALYRHRLSLAAAAAFLVWGLLGAVILPAAHAPSALSGFWHPVWAAFDSQNRSLSIAPYRALEGAIAFLGPVSAFALGALEPQSRASRNWALALVTYMAAGLPVLALLEYILLSRGSGLRLSLFFVSPNSAATCFGVTAVLCAALAAREVRRNSKRLSTRYPEGPARLFAALARAPVPVVGFAFSLSCVALTGSRAGFAASVLALLAFAGIMALARVLKARFVSGATQWLFGLMVVAGALLLLAGGHVMFSRLGHASADLADRSAIWATHWRAFLDRPILGHGLNSFREINAYYATPENWTALAGMGAAHNIFLQLLEETGVVGAVLMAAALAAPIWNALMTVLSGERGFEWAGACFAAALLCFLHGAVDFGLQTPAIAALLAYCLALPASAPDGWSEGGEALASSKDSQASRFAPT